MTTSQSLWHLRPWKPLSASSCPTSRTSQTQSQHTCRRVALQRCWSTLPHILHLSLVCCSHGQGQGQAATRRWLAAAVHPSRRCTAPGPRYGHQGLQLTPLTQNMNCFIPSSLAKGSSPSGQGPHNVKKTAYFQLQFIRLTDEQCPCPPQMTTLSPLNFYLLNLSLFLLFGFFLLAFFLPDIKTGSSYCGSDSLLLLFAGLSDSSMWKCCICCRMNKPRWKCILLWFTWFSKEEAASLNRACKRILWHSHQWCKAPFWNEDELRV